MKKGFDSTVLRIAFSASMFARMSLSRSASNPFRASSSSLRSPVASPVAASASARSDVMVASCSRTLTASESRSRRSASAWASLSANFSEKTSLLASTSARRRLSFSMYSTTSRRIPGPSRSSMIRSGTTARACSQSRAACAPPVAAMAASCSCCSSWCLMVAPARSRSFMSALIFAASCRHCVRCPSSSACTARYAEPPASLLAASAFQWSTSRRSSSILSLYTRTVLLKARWARLRTAWTSSSTASTATSTSSRSASAQPAECHTRCPRSRTSTSMSGGSPGPAVINGAPSLRAAFVTSTMSCWHRAYSCFRVCAALTVAKADPTSAAELVEGPGCSGTVTTSCAPNSVDSPPGPSMRSSGWDDDASGPGAIAPACGVWPSEDEALVSRRPPRFTLPPVLSVSSGLSGGRPP
mmetsp:Transcript_2821/g.8759  ORF Transcript_2821/g.8759 Transcript_2821/m.8759 type:complete len:414 (+) Transcript_2821:1600-2841(+)